MGSNKIKMAIALIGKPNSGKTATLRELARHLLSIQGARLISRKSCLRYVYSKISDVTVAVEVFGRRILIRSAGDDEHELKYTFERAIKLQCDIVVFAVSTPERDGGIKAVYDYYCQNKMKFVEKISEIRKCRVEVKSEIAREMRKTVSNILDMLEMT